jgi:hypothetical protein
MLAPLIEVVTRLAKSWLREKSLGNPVSPKDLKNELWSDQGFIALFRAFVRLQTCG